MLMGPKCLPNTTKLVKIVKRANQLNHLLKKQRGKVLCSMGMRAAEEQQLRAVKINSYGLSESHVKDVMISKSTHADEENQKVSSSSWSDEEIVELAIKDLERTGQVVRGERYLATRDFKQMEMGLQCRVKLGVLNTIQKKFRDPHEIDQLSLKLSRIHSI
ncbi:hypothetical protein PCANC_23405 [Puccinia coronata f. sp. avenae]|uniref:Man1/Src1-like C-terminal domain-containing protein n=1 Tax=Puccinia coronata f. sp. avenae TaxID=200324 RepID=A0A2N5T986_9BASI|nr:hypothetical protein PCASD_18082 [Puccinia coronata f. sp. avenae]PLW27871.1 hypothetical protein PCANC_23405 [Puccinia coronata f. sp. avenae]